MHDDVERVLADQRQRWLAGDKVSVEALLAGEPRLLADEEAVVELLLGEYRLRAEVGDSTDIEAMLGRFPAVAGRLRPTLRLMAFLSAYSLKTTSVLDRRRGSDTPNLDPDPEAAPPAALPVVPNYVIEGRLGSGGRGVVYKAWQPDAERTVALKMIKDDEADNPEALKWFEREWKAVARLSHPNIVQLFELGKCDARPYFTMEYVDGGTLTKLLGGKPMPAREAAALVEVLARAVQHAHERGVVHRDLKPGNVLVSADGMVKLVDFGLAKRLGGEPSLIDNGTIVGTVAYMAPEQAAGKNDEVGPWSDVWGLGAIMYQCLTGRPPFFDEDLVQLLLKIQTDEPAALGRGVPVDLATVCLKCLEKAPGRRYSSAAALAEELRRAQAGEPVDARPLRWHEKALRRTRQRWRPLAVSALLLAVVVGALVLDRLRPARQPSEGVDLAEARRGIDRTLASGQPYVVEGARYLPGPFKWVVGSAGLPIANARHGCITYETTDLGLLEIVSAPRCDSYRFLIEVRHEGVSGEQSLVGVYVGYQEGKATAEETVGSFLSFTYADLGRASVNLECCCFRSRPDPPSLAPRAMLAPQFLPDPALRRGELAAWRTLEVEVRRGGVQATWHPGQGDPVRLENAPQEEIVRMLRLRRGDKPELAEAPVAYAPAGGLGLFLWNAKASVRRIVLEPVRAE